MAWIGISIPTKSQAILSAASALPRDDFRYYRILFCSKPLSADEIRTCVLGRIKNLSPELLACVNRGQTDERWKEQGWRDSKDDSMLILILCLILIRRRQAIAQRDEEGLGFCSVDVPSRSDPSS